MVALTVRPLGAIDYAEEPWTTPIHFHEAGTSLAIVLGVMTIGGLVLASFWVVRPFLLAAIWATMIVVSTWPTLLAVQARLWGRRSLAVLVMTA
jgi:predicted PurR-regulated permease PerM